MRKVIVIYPLEQDACKAEEQIRKAVDGREIVQLEYLNLHGALAILVEG